MKIGFYVRSIGIIVLNTLIIIGCIDYLGESRYHCFNTMDYVKQCQKQATLGLIGIILGMSIIFCINIVLVKYISKKVSLFTIITIIIVIITYMLRYRF